MYTPSNCTTPTLQIPLLRAAAQLSRNPPELQATMFALLAGMGCLAGLDMSH